MERTNRLRDLLVQLYGREAIALVQEQLLALIEEHRPRIRPRGGGLSQRDSFLITYPDQLRAEGIPSLRVLADFVRSHLSPILNSIHILPFYPWTSDDGFAVADYRQVALGYGSWEEVEALSADFRLMFDAVINHASTAHVWFQGFLSGDPRYRDYFITPPEDADLSRVARPRTLPLLTPFDTADGTTKVWTTFSADQVDLNYKNPEVLLEIVEVLLYYVERGAQFLRLDAIAYLWKEPGTTSIHLPQAHAVIKLLRAVMDEVAPHVALITETNVPQQENLSYLGDGTDEAQMVYNFPLPPLVLHAFQTGSAEVLSKWAAGLSLPSREVSFYNFLASHDGIGLNPLHGILPEGEINQVVERVKAHGGMVSFKDTRGGGPQPYELNINYFDALNDPRAQEVSSLQVERFLAAHAILLAMPGVPAIYFHSLVGWRGWPEGAAETGRSRTVNRQKFDRKEVETVLADPDSRQAQVFAGLAQLLRSRAERQAFHPSGSWRVLEAGPQLFGLLRAAPDGGSKVLCLHNVGNQECQVRQEVLGALDSGPGRDILSGRSVSTGADFRMKAYEVVWLE